MKDFLSVNFGKNVETQKMAVNGWNWGKVSFGGRRSRFESKENSHFLFLLAANLSFEVDHKQAFEVPLKNVSNSNKGKNEITLQFHQADDAKVSLMEIRFYVPPGDVDGDAVEVSIEISGQSVRLLSIGFPSKCHERCRCIDCESR